MPTDPSAPTTAAATLRPILLPQLLQRGGELSLSVLQPLAELQDAELVRGWIRLRHLGTALEVEGEASTTLACRCDRCLRPFPLPLRAQAHERFCLDRGRTQAGEGGPNDQLVSSAWLNDAGGRDPQTWLGEDPEERLDPQGVFDPEHWLFEQLSLQRPLVYHCGPDCPGPDRWSSADAEPDRRWQALRQLRPDGA